MTVDTFDRSGWPKSGISQDEAPPSLATLPAGTPSQGGFRARVLLLLLLRG